ncbi:hypothetical protein Stsp01_53810 [Streptomyces sp. NBRC 13847]|nr:hypothetical protein Stsp01_53810 [Streptomyces sp. NBRC 13847]
MANGPGHREGHAQTTLERLAPGHGHLRFSVSRRPAGLSGERPGGRQARTRAAAGPGVHAQFLRRNKEDLTED